MGRGKRRCNKISRQNCKKRRKERREGAAEDKEELQNNNKQCNRRFRLKEFSKTDLNS